MVQWPKACIGCGDTNESNLELHDFTHKEGDSYSSGDIVTFTERSIGVFAYLCPSCNSSARNKYVISLIALLPIFIVLFILAIATGFLGLVLFMPLWTLTMCMCINLAPKYNWANFYMKMNLRGSIPVYHFRNPQYEQIFKSINSDAITKKWKKMFDLYIHWK